MEDGNGGSDATPQQQETQPQYDNNYQQPQYGQYQQQDTGNQYQQPYTGWQDGQVLLPPPPSDGKQHGRLRIILAVILAVILIAVAGVGGYYAGGNKGYSDGYSAGSSAGYDTGYEDGTADGYDTGYDEGHDDGYANGVSDWGDLEESTYPVYSIYRSCHSYSQNDDDDYLVLISTTLVGREEVASHTDGETELFTCVADAAGLSDSLRSSILVDGSEGDTTVGDLYVSWTYADDDGLLDLMLVQSI